MTLVNPGEIEPTLKTVVILPVYNEADTIGEVVMAAHRCLSLRDGEVEYLIAEDGSTDGTNDILARLQAVMPDVKVLSSRSRKGYPRAAKDAILSVDQGVEYIGFMDSDDQYDPNDLRKICESARVADMVIGKRINRAESPLRVFLSTGLRLLERTIYKVECDDVTSALRVMRRSVAQSVASEVRYSKYSFWAEFTAIASLRGTKIVEIPVTYRHRRSGDSRVYSYQKLAQIVLSEFVALAKTWLRTRKKPPRTTTMVHQT